MISIGAQLKMIHGLLGTDSINGWEHNFISSVWEKTTEARDTTMLTEKQVESIEKIYTKNFA